MIGDVGQPNFAETSAMKSASRCPSHLRKTLHASQVTRFACGPADEPMTPRRLPQVQACDNCTFMPMIGEVEDGADDGGDDDPNKSSCCSMYAASVDGRRGATLDGKPLSEGAFGQLRDPVRGHCLLSREVRDPVVEVVRRLLLRLLHWHRYSDAVDELAFEQHLFALECDDVANPVLRAGADGCGQNVEIARVGDERLLFPCEVQDRFEASVVKLNVFDGRDGDARGLASQVLSFEESTSVSVIFTSAHWRSPCSGRRR